MCLLKVTVSGRSAASASADGCDNVDDAASVVRLREQPRHASLSFHPGCSNRRPQFAAVGIALAGDDGFECIPQIVRRRLRPFLAQSNIPVVDPPAIEDLARRRKDDCLRRSRRPGSPHPRLFGVQDHRRLDIVFLRMFPGLLGSRRPDRPARSSSSTPRGANSACSRLISGRYEFAIGQSGSTKIIATAFTPACSNGRTWLAVDID